MNRFLFFFFLICYTAYAQKPQIQNFELDFSATSSSYTIDNNGNQWNVNVLYSPHIAENYMNIIKLDSCQNIIFSKRYGDFTNFTSLILNVRSIITIPNSDEVIVLAMSYANNGHTSPLIIRLSPDGDPIWVKRYLFQNLHMSNSYEVFQNDDEFIVPCKMAINGGGSAYSSFLRFDYDGTYIESSRFADSYTGLSVIQLNDNEFLWRSYNQLARTTLNGDVVWAKEYTALLAGSNFFAGVEVDNKAIFYVNIQNKKFLTAFDLDGNYLWQSEELDIETFPKLFETNSKDIGLAYSKSNPKEITYSVFNPIDGSLNYSKNLNASSFISSGTNLMNIVQKNDKTYLNFMVNPQNSQTVIDLEHINCISDFDLETTVNNRDSSFNNIIAGFYTGKVELLGVEEFELDTGLVSVNMTVGCINHTLIDTTVTKAYIDCDSPPFQIENPDLSTSYYWLHNGSSDPYETLTNPGTYQVQINGCSSRLEVIELSSICDCRLTFPTAFSPNGDGLNDVFAPVDNCGIEFYKLKIWDRWGKLLFKSDAVDQVWDGSFDNKNLSTGVYIYEVNYAPLTINPSEHTVKKTGSFTLIK